MSRVSKWKLEKTKVKVVFRLQFHATHIPPTGWDKLFISFIPADTGKATAKTTKANVRNGSCKWADPIYETTRLLQDSKSKQYDEKLYKIIVAMGSSRASTLGEATINLADYVNALKPSAITLPLHGCNSGTVLHITVQLLTSKTGFREFEQQRELRERGLPSGVDGHGHSVTDRISHSEEVTSDQTDKASASRQLKADATELSSVDGEAKPNDEYADSATGFDGSSNTSGSMYAEKHETSCTPEVDSLKSTMSGDVDVVSRCQSPSTAKEYPSNRQNTAQGSSDNSINNELSMACEENNLLRGSLETAESSLFNLKLEVSSLQSLAEELGAETQKFSHQLVAEISSAKELGKEVSAMKSECLILRDDINRLKDLKVSHQIPRVEAKENQEDSLVRNMQLQFLNGISVLEGKIRELLVPQDGDMKFIYSELEALLDFLLDFKLGRADVKEITVQSRYKDDRFASRNMFGLDLCEPETVLQNFVMGPPMSEALNPQGSMDAMKGQIFDLVRELDEAKVEKEALTQKANEMECYYEAFIQELEENQKRLLGEMQHLRNEHSTCLYALSVCKTEMESLREETNQQMLRFADEKHELEALNKELERRATTSEAALRRARLNYSIAVDKLQKDLGLLSSQVFSMFETNENVIKQALPSQSDSQVGRSLHRNFEDDVKRSSPLENQNLSFRKISVGGDVIFEDLKRSFLMQEELYQKVQEELVEMYSVNLNLDIYSNILEESLWGAGADIKIMKGRAAELEEELRVSTASQSHLMVRLQKAADEIHALNEYKSSSISQCSEMALQNHILEEKIVSVSGENYQLSQKLKDWDDTILEIRSYQSKYSACLAENAELSLHLEQKALENENHRNELSHLKEELMILKSELEELVSSNGKLEEDMKFVQEKLTNMLSSYTEQISFLDNCQSHNFGSFDLKDAILQLEEILNNSCMKNHQLLEEIESLKGEKANADVSLSAVRSEIRTMKQKLKSGVQDMVTKLDLSNALVDKLQAELESVANKLLLSSEIEEEFAQQKMTLLADLTLLEDQMQELTCKNGLLAREISGLDSLAEELGRSKLNIFELMHDKQELFVCLQEKTEESNNLSCENSSLKETLKTLGDELLNEKAYKNKLEEQIQDLKVCLAEGDEMSLHLKQEALENENLMNELSRLKEELIILKAEKDDLVSSKGELQGTIEFVQDKLTNLFSSCTEESSLLDNFQSRNFESVDIKDAILQLEEILHDACIKNHRLMEEIESLKSEKADADASLCAVRSEILTMKQKYKSGIKDVVTKLDVSNALMDKLQAELESVANKLSLSSEVEEEFVQENTTLLADLALLEDQMQELTCKNGHLAREILRLDSLAEELGRSKLNITELMHDKQELAVCLQEKIEESNNISRENGRLKETLKTIGDELLDEKAYKNKLEEQIRGLKVCLAENADLSLHLKEEALENENLTNELSHLKEELMILKAESDNLASSKGKLEGNIKFVQDKLATLFSSYSKQFSLLGNCQIHNLETSDIKDAILQLEEIQDNACIKNHQLMEETESLKSEKAELNVSLNTVSSEIQTMKQKFKSGIQDMVMRLDLSNALVNKLQAELESVANKIHLGSEIEEEFAQQNAILLADLAFLEVQMQQLMCKNGHLAREISGLDSVAEEIGRSKLSIAELMHDKQELVVCLQEKTEESNSLSCENSHLKETLKSLRDELLDEKAFKNELEEQVRDLKLCLSKDQHKLLEFEQEKAELMHVRKLASDLETEKSHLLCQQNELIEKLEESSSCRASYESQLLEMYDYSLAVDVKHIYVSNNYEALVEELLGKLESSDFCLRKLQKRNCDTESMLNHSLSGEADWRQEKSNLLEGLERLKSDFGVVTAQNKLLSDSNNEFREQTEECRRKLTMMETLFLTQASEVRHLRNMATDAEEEIDYLILTKEELEISVMVLKGKVEEQTANLTLSNDYKRELMILRSRFNELSHKLAEQSLKTEEFKNLSIHLKELKDKAEAECLAAREKRETEVPSATVQDSLRIAFIKEQYETKVQELKQQLSMSKKHGEEMLLKLQDAIDEIETRKKSEAVSLKKNEELFVRLSTLDAELMSALSEKREKNNAYDRAKAELECAQLTLECCKEEKEKLGASLLEFKAEKSQLAGELTLMKRELEDLKILTNFEKDEYGSVTEVAHALNGSTGNTSPLFLKQDESTCRLKRETSVYENSDSIEPISIRENADSTDPPVQLQITQDVASFTLSTSKNLNVNSEDLGAQRLRSNIKHLHEELEKMKNENTILSIGHDLDSGFQVTQREIMQLHQANEELRSMFPSFDEISSGGNALDRVLALEIELADALKTKNKSNIQFQSSFLKQHSDEEAVFKSFRDINELIREMLEVKGRHAAVEAELLEMHDRYSQLSLRFAEVEGERQKLKMTLKNVRSPR